MCIVHVADGHVAAAIIAVSAGLDHARPIEMEQRPSQIFLRVHGDGADHWQPGPAKRVLLDQLDLDERCGPRA
jgi:hypothetical protein